MAGYTVRVADNFHYMDESETYTLGVFQSLDEAIAQCRCVVERSLREQLKPGMTAEGLYQQYVGFGEDPFVLEEQGPSRFSAWDYARERCDSMTSPSASDPELPESESHDAGISPEVQSRQAWTALGGVAFLLWSACLLCLWGMFQPAFMNAADGFNAVAGSIPVFSASTAFSIVAVVAGGLALVRRGSQYDSRRFVAGTFGWLGSMLTFFLMLPGRLGTPPPLENRMFAFYVIPILVMLGARTLVGPLAVLAGVPRAQQTPS